MTGFSDPVYAEAYVHVNQYDIVLDVLVVNQTSDTLQNCTLELATLGEDMYPRKGFYIICLCDELLRKGQSFQCEDPFECFVTLFNQGLV